MKEAEARAILDTIPGVGPVTIDVVVSELGDIRRFRSQKKVCAYAGLVPGQRESAGRTRELSITKEGSKLLRWVLVQAAWRLVNQTARWGRIFEGLRKRRGKKKAIVALMRQLGIKMWHRALGCGVSLELCGRGGSHDLASSSGAQQQGPDSPVPRPG